MPRTSRILPEIRRRNLLIEPLHPINKPARRGQFDRFFHLELLEQAGIIFPVIHSSSNEIPLGDQTNIKFRKYLILDTGVYRRYLNLDLSELLLNTEISLVNKGAIAELFAGLELIKANRITRLHHFTTGKREKRKSG